MTGANLRVDCKNRRQAAERGSCKSRNLARCRTARKVGVAEGIRKSTPDANHLFRTPSLNGQVWAECSNLPAFLRVAGRLRSDRQNIADKFTSTLWNLRGGSWVISSSISIEEGSTPCVSSNSLSFSAFWPRFRPVVTHWVNRRFTVQGPARQRQRCWMATSSAVRRSVRQATRCIARTTPASADNSYTSGLIALHTTHSIEQAAFGHPSGCGFLHSNILQPKDYPCSTRS